VADFLAVRAVLAGDAELESDVRLADELRWAQRGGAAGSPHGPLG
jgi:hypothetical protein